MDEELKNLNKGSMLENITEKEMLLNELTNEYGYDFHNSKKNIFDYEKILKKLPNKINQSFINQFQKK